MHPGSPIDKLIVPARLQAVSPSTLECVRRFRRRVERRPLENVSCARGAVFFVCGSVHACVWHVFVRVRSFCLRWHALD